jgi:hypothetical protein
MLGRELITELEAHRSAVAPCRAPVQSRLAVVAGEYLLLTAHALAVLIAVLLPVRLSVTFGSVSSPFGYVVFRLLLHPPWSAEQQEATHRGATRASPSKSDALLSERNAREGRSAHLKEHGAIRRQVASAWRTDGQLHCGRAWVGNGQQGGGERASASVAAASVHVTHAARVALKQHDRVLTVPV